MATQVYGHTHMQEKDSIENNKIDNGCKLSVPVLVYSPILDYSQYNWDSNELEPKPRMQPRTGTTMPIFPSRASQNNTKMLHRAIISGRN